MEITNVGVRLVTRASDRLKAFCTITIDDSFVVRDLKVVDGPNGLFVAMPSRKRMQRCPACGHKNEVRARHCNDCGGQLPADRGNRSHNDKSSSHTDIAHPINSECREMIQRRVLDAYAEEAEEQQKAAEQQQKEAVPSEPEESPTETATPAAPAGSSGSSASSGRPPDDNDAFGAGIL